MAEFIKIDLRENRQETWILQISPIGNLKKKNEYRKRMYRIIRPSVHLMLFPPIIFKYLYKLLKGFNEA